MRFIVVIFLVFFIQSCSTTQSNRDAIQLSALFNEKSSFNKQKVKVKGYLDIEYDTYYLKKAKEAKEHIDLVFVEENTLEKEGCIKIEGVFKEYNDNFIAMGYLTSKYGLIEVYSFEYIKCE